MLKSLLLRILGAAFLSALTESALPEAAVSDSVRRLLRLIETLLIAEPLIGLIRSLM